MNRLVERVQALRSAGRCGIAPYVTAGDGGLDRTLEVLRGIEEVGATCVELGLPFSDPIADGPALQSAAQRALAGGTTLDGVLELVRTLRKSGGELPLLCFTYLNPLLAGGLARNIVRLADAGFDGVLVPDVPVEESGPLCDACEKAGLAPVLFTAPTTSDERIRRAADASRGFLYVVGRTGVTGASTALEGAADAYLARVRALAGELPLGVGFGIRTAAQVAAVAKHAELAIVGTALVQHLHETAERAAADGLDPVAAARAAAQSFVLDLSAGAPA